MLPTRVQATNFRCYPTLDWTIQPGATALVGPNGAGKTTRLMAVETGLFAGRGELSSAEVLRAGEDTVQVCVEVAHRGERYRVRRSHGKRGATCDFERCNQVRVSSNGDANFDDTIPTTEAWTPLTCHSIDDTNKLICDTFGLDRQTFRASAYLGQNAGSFAASDTTPKQRMELFSTLLGLGVYQRLADLARQELTVAKTELALLESRATDAREVVAGKAEVEAELDGSRDQVTAGEKALTDAQEQLDDATRRFHEAREQLQHVETAQANVEACTAEVWRLRAVTDAADTARDHLVTLEARQRELHPLVEELPAHETRERELRQTVEEHRRLVGEYQARVGFAATLQTQQQDLWARVRKLTAAAHELDEQRRLVFLREQDTCDRCGQKLGEEASVRMAASLQAEAENLRAEATALIDDANAIEVPEVGEPPAPVDTTALDAIAARVHKGRQAQVELASLAARLSAERGKITAAEDPAFVAAIADSVERLTAAQSALEQATEAAPDTVTIAQIKQNDLHARAAVNETTQHLTDTRADLARLEERLARITDTETVLAGYEQQAETLHARIDILALAERAHGRAGIPALVVENQVGQIEADTSRILSELGGATANARVELRTQKPNKDGTVQDRLDVVLVTADGWERPFDSFSGGERMRIDIALRWALAAGTGVEIVVLDEPAALDDEGKAALRAIIEWLLANGVVTVLVVSHEPALRDAFDNVVEVRKTASVGPVRETVAA